MGTQALSEDEKSYAASAPSDANSQVPLHVYSLAFFFFYVLWISTDIGTSIFALISYYLLESFDSFGSQVMSYNIFVTVQNCIKKYIENKNLSKAKYGYIKFKRFYTYLHNTCYTGSWNLGT